MDIYDVKQLLDADALPSRRAVGSALGLSDDELATLTPDNVFVFPASGEGLPRAQELAGRYDWITFSSVLDQSTWITYEQKKLYKLRS